MGPLLEGRHAPLVVSGNPGLNGAATASQGLGDRGDGVALLGEDDGLVTKPDPFGDRHELIYLPLGDSRFDSDVVLGQSLRSFQSSLNLFPLFSQ